ncbi:hypothetical protein, partial [Candidatus Allofournierella excrementavium]|uniref:hypothetical protein n=1 Tax=Candidatus Allofournierella excrementavium TaxID=2838591 RepID=UPI003AB3355D
KLSSVVPKILGWRRPGKIGRCRLSLCPFSRALARWQGPFFFVFWGEALSLQRSRAPGDGVPAMLRRCGAAAVNGVCAAGAKGRAMWRFWDGKCKSWLLQVMQRKRAFPRPAQRCGGVMTVVADSLHSGKGQDQAALLAEKRKDRLLQVLAKKKSVPQAGAA